MAIEFALEICTPLAAPQIADVVVGITRDLALTDPAVTPQDLLDGALTVRGTWIRIRDKKPEPWHTIPTELGFTPTIFIRFRMSKVDDILAQQDDMVRITARILEAVPGDAVLHRELETGWLVRKGGVVSLNERTDLWTAERLAMMPQPYQRESITLDG